MASPQHMVNFMVMVFHALSIAAQSGGEPAPAKSKGGMGGKKRKTGRRDGDEKVDEEDEEVAKGDNELLGLVPGLLTVMAAVMASLRPQLEEVNPDRAAGASEFLEMRRRASEF